jgi:hypothetical protein
VIELCMNDFSAPMLDDTAPPRMFRTVTAKAVAYDMDFVDYLITQECIRRSENNQPVLSGEEIIAFRRDLIGALIIQGNPNAAIAMRTKQLTKQSAILPTSQTQLNG